MKYSFPEEPRKFKVGSSNHITLTDCGEVFLGSDEMLTFKNLQGGEYDFVRKNWGYYVTPSIGCRLKRFGYRIALVKNSNGMYFIMAVENNHDSQFRQYLEEDKQDLICWLTDENLKAVEGILGSINHNCPICMTGAGDVAHEFLRPPEKEVNILSAEMTARGYQRKIYECNSCGHFWGDQVLDLESLYGGKYNECNYQDESKMERTFEKIMSLPNEKSDNRQRCRRVSELCSFMPGMPKYLMDVGSGLGVFPVVMESLGWQVDVVDPDQKSIRLIMNKSKNIHGYNSDFLKVKEFGANRYSLITFNRVLEHVPNPQDYLAHALKFLKPNGLIYLELPDGETAAKQSWDREEFTIDHLHIFSFKSLVAMLSKFKVEIMEVKRVIEPSGKFGLNAVVRSIDE